MNRVKEFRLEKGLTQCQLGFAIGKSQRWIWELENGYLKAKKTQREKLSEVLGVGAEELFPPEEAPRPAQAEEEPTVAWLPTQT